MFLRSAAARATVAGLASLALAASTAPALAGAGDKVPDQRLGAGVPAGAATPLTHDTPIVDEEPGGVDEYTYDTTFNYWSVTGLRPEDATANLTLYDADGNRLAQSKEKKAKVDFVAVDSDEAPYPATYFPTVKSKGSGAYAIELDANADLLFDFAPVDLTFGEDDVVFIADTYGGAGSTYTITADPTTGLKIAMYLMRTDPTDPTSFYQGRAQAIAKSEQKKSKTESITFTGVDDFYGVVVVSEGGSGTVTLTKTPA
jgi:hypothetical protein